MKLIIEIPKEYKVLFDTERCKSKFSSLASNEFGYVLRKAFENGIPLDSVKGEIEASMYCDKDTRFVENANASGLKKALEIIDKCIGDKE